MCVYIYIDLDQGQYPQKVTILVKMELCPDETSNWVPLVPFVLVNSLGE